MSWKTFTIIILTIALAVMATLYWTKPKRVVIRVPIPTQVDTVFVPDTVIVEKEKPIIIRDTVVTIDTVKIIDVVKNTKAIYRSIKEFRKDDLALRVDAYAPCPVDSFRLKYSINYDRYLTLHGLLSPPEFGLDVRKQRLGFWEGLAAGSALTVSGIGLAQGKYREVALGWGTVGLIYLTYKLTK